MKAVVTNSFMVCYGTTNKAWIALNQGQVWSVKSEPKYPQFPWWSVKRGNVLLDIMPGDFARHFEIKE